MSDSDIKHIDTTDIDQLQAACDAIPTCKGFNSNGWLKFEADQLQFAPCNFYIRRTGPPPPFEPLIWPIPQQFTNGSSTVVVGSGFSFNSSSTSTVITTGIERYKDLTFDHGTPQTSGQLMKLQIIVTSADETLQLETDESYVLDIPTGSDTATLQANTVFGALHGLETFSQLVRYSFDRGTYEIPNAPWHIKDWPRFPHRGLLVDTSRHFEPIKTLYAVIDSLTYAKMNVLVCCLLLELK